MSMANTVLATLFALAIFGHNPKTSGDVQRYGWPRTDLHVMVGKTRVEPALALGSWAAFSGGMVMGDLVLRPSELDPVIRALHAGGFEISAVHNHLSGEIPEIVYVHYAGHGEMAALAATLENALAKTSTPREEVAAAPSSSPAFDTINEVLGRKGNVNGRVLQFSVPRAETITDNGMTIPPAMGVATAINFQDTGTGVATTGDFVLIADEVDPVMRELERANIHVTALHSHMLRESPRMFFMHFWGTGSPRAIAEGIRNALAKVKTAS